jgi:hypothetical protein
MIRVNKFILVAIFRSIWLIVAAAIVLYIIGQAIVTDREIVYQIDNTDSITRDITGWYPEQRTIFLEEEHSLQLRSEPLYMQVYTPIDFKTLKVAGDIYFKSETVRLGLKQEDGSWEYRDVTSENFMFEYDLSQAQVKKNKLELILSVPDLTATSTVTLSNNWILSLER